MQYFRLCIQSATIFRLLLLLSVKLVRRLPYQFSLTLSFVVTRYLKFKVYYKWGLTVLQQRDMARRAAEDLQQLWSGADTDSPVYQVSLFPEI